MTRFGADMEFDCKITLFTNADQGDRRFHFGDDPQTIPPPSSTMAERWIFFS